MKDKYFYYIKRMCISHSVSELDYIHRKVLDDIDLTETERNELNSIYFTLLMEY